MSASSRFSVLLLLGFAGCQDPAEDTGPYDCWSLRGGYEGADLEGVEAICENGLGTNCDPAVYMEADAARCFAVYGAWDESFQTTLDASLAYSAYFRRVLWTLTEDSCAAGVDATTGEVVLRACGEPR